MLNGHGDDAYKYGGNIIADFSTNVWYGGEPAGLKEYLFENWEAVNRYPDVAGERLSSKIANHLRLSDQQILVNSGTTESIYLIAQLFYGKSTTIVVPSFSEYEDACKMHAQKLSFLPWEQIGNCPKIDSDLIFICNPNNPTGQTFHRLAHWISRNPQCLFVVDEAFIDFTEDIYSSLPLINMFDNLIIMRSLTKIYAIPGLRLGYIAAQAHWIEKLLKIKQPWTVNTMALAAGDFIFDHFDAIRLPLKELLSDRADFVKKLRENDALRIYDSQTHFFLVETLIGNAAALKSFLLEKHGLLIRDARNFRNLSNRHFRLATLRPDKNELIINALPEWKKSR